MSLTWIGFTLLTALPPDSPAPDVLRDYQAAAAQAGRDAKAHVRLALWCEAHGLETQRLEHLKTALQVNPDDPTARGLLGQVLHQGQWKTPEEVAACSSAEKDQAGALADYRIRRERIPDTAEAHWQLAEWCAQNNLPDEARVHYQAVVRLDPAREQAWENLGYRKQKDRWVNSEQIAAERSEASAQQKADKHWSPLFEKWRSWLGQRSKTKRAQAEAGLARVDDPRAVPAIMRVFSAAGPDNQDRAAQVLRALDAPAASRALAWLAAFGVATEIRTLAATSLIGRDPREFADFLIGLLRAPVKYEVRRVGGPGSPGELYVEGKRLNNRIFYNAPAPLATFQPADTFAGYDANGLPIVNRVVTYVPMPIAAALDPTLTGAPDLSNAAQALGQTKLGAAGQALGQKMYQNQQQNTAIATGMQNVGALIPRDGYFRMPITAQIPVGQLMAQANQRAMSSQQQLEEDLAALERYNKDVNLLNIRVLAALQTASGKNLGSDRGSWSKWWSTLVATSSAAPVPPRDSGGQNATAAAESNARADVPSFAAGTQVWTVTGLRPIEDLRAGDKVLTQDAATGALGFAPVLTTRPVVREPVKSITIGDSTVIATDLERFWVAGKGFIKARDLEPGDAVRALNGALRVGAIADAGTRPVYHIEVVDGRVIVVGQRGVLAHDHRLAQPWSARFDAAAKDDTPWAARPH
jgi:hypothetical protein